MRRRLPSRPARSRSCSRTSRARRGCSNDSGTSTRTCSPSSVVCCAPRSRSGTASRSTLKATRSSSRSRARSTPSTAPSRRNGRSPPTAGRSGAPLRVRMALHTGEPIVQRTGYVGMDVHRAARIGAAAHGGQILVSGSTRELVAADMPPGLELVSLGELPAEGRSPAGGAVPGPRRRPAGRLPSPANRRARVTSRRPLASHRSRARVLRRDRRAALLRPRGADRRARRPGRLRDGSWRSSARRAAARARSSAPGSCPPSAGRLTRTGRSARSRRRHVPSRRSPSP